MKKVSMVCAALLPLGCNSKTSAVPVEDLTGVYILQSIDENSIVSKLPWTMNELTNLMTKYNRYPGQAPAVEMTVYASRIELLPDSTFREIVKRDALPRKGFERVGKVVVIDTIQGHFIHLGAGLQFFSELTIFNGMPYTYSESHVSEGAYSPREITIFSEHVARRYRR